MKKNLNIFCIMFTAIILLCSFSYYINNGHSHSSINGKCYQVDEVVVDGQSYMVVFSATGSIAICKK